MIVAAAYLHKGIIWTGDRHCNIVNYLVNG